MLVGLPFAGLFVVMRAGASLEAPPVVAGTWPLPDHEARACLGIGSEDAIAVQQSGRFLHLRAGTTVADGRIVGSRLQVSWLPSSGPCAGRELAIDARIDGEGIRGALRAASCEPCRDVTFETTPPTE
ncbi:hypothetical protein DB32_004960 [Sandaracinus amylolyticus]|uniref:Uncharacterized protein n=1 Tax=Sandaracinus amylolyticus TaxID=927083 RepID=A0A0F6W5B8_9BACT|nr:hypothetical protein DB32_004960 [Sandaracinus amylolyticus]